MESFENKINGIIRDLENTTSYPDPPDIREFRVSQTKLQAKRKRLRRLLVVAIAALVGVSAIGAAAMEYFFPSSNQAFRAVQDRGYVNVIHSTQKKDGISLTVQALFIDGLNTYVKIRATGDLPEPEEGCPIRDSQGGWLVKRIRDAEIIEAGGQSISYRNQTIYADSNMSAVMDAPLLRSEELKKGEAVLVFQGGPDKDTSLAFRLTFINGVTFEVDPIPVKVAPLTVRTFDDLTFQTDYGHGKILKIQYSLVETRLDIEWTVFEDIREYHMANKGVYINGEDVHRDVLPYPNFYKEDGLPFTQSYVLPFPVDPHQSLRIARYQQDYSTYMGDWVYIEAA